MAFEEKFIMINLGELGNKSIVNLKYCFKLSSQ